MEVADVLLRLLRSIPLDRGRVDNVAFLGDTKMVNALKNGVLVPKDLVLCVIGKLTNISRSVHC